jgi:branched-subunit amino acid transport protein
MKVIIIILGMAFVTYLPRLLPALFLDRFKFPEWFGKWMENIPYAALGALIFPGVLLVEKDQPALGLIGGVTAFLLALLNLHIILIMAGSIGVVLLIQWVF